MLEASGGIAPPSLLPLLQIYKTDLARPLLLATLCTRPHYLFLPPSLHLLVIDTAPLLTPPLRPVVGNFLPLLPLHRSVHAIRQWGLSSLLPWSLAPHSIGPAPPTLPAEEGAFLEVHGGPFFHCLQTKKPSPSSGAPRHKEGRELLFPQDFQGGRERRRRKREPPRKMEREKRACERERGKGAQWCFLGLRV